MKPFQTILIGGDPAKRAAKKIGEFDYLVGQTLSIKGFVNPGATEKFTLINCGKDWCDLPVFQDLQEAVRGQRSVNSVGIYLNAKHVLKWVKECCKFDQIENIVIFAEDVPEKDAREICHLSLVTGKNIVGPSSTGMLLPGSSRLGEIGGDWYNLNMCGLDHSGSVGLITKSGTMSGELLWVVSQNSPGINMAVQLGGDAFPATDFVWWLKKYAENPEIKVVVMSGEAGGDLEERAAEWYGKYIKSQISNIKNTNQISKIRNDKFKLIAVISGQFLEKMPKGQKFGHAGAKQEESGFGSAKHKIELLKKAGVEVMSFEELGETLRKLTKGDIIET